MEIFLSWSGERSKAAARAFESLLPSILQPVKCWMSEGGLAKGKPWFDQLTSKLEGIVFGVFFVTPENIEAQWMMWEAGFLSSSSKLGARRVAPIGIGISKGALGNGPLSIYQGTDSTREDILRLIKDINDALPEDRRIATSALESTFSFVWPELEKKIAEAVAMSASAPVSPKPKTEDSLAQIVALLQQGQRDASETKALVRQLETEVSSLPRPIGFSPGIFRADTGNYLIGSGVNDPKSGIAGVFSNSWSPPQNPNRIVIGSAADAAQGTTPIVLSGKPDPTR